VAPVSSWLAGLAGGVPLSAAAWRLGGARARAEVAALRRSNAELERFAAVASHDLREPLRSMTGFLALLRRRRAAHLDADARAWIEQALRGAERMDELIGELLEHSRLGGANRPAVPTDLGAAWAAAIRDLSGAIEASGADVWAGPLPTVAAEPAEMVRLLQNLVGNAIKYRRPDRRPLVRVEATQRGGAWEIAVSDNGIGIHPRDHERIFLLLERLHGRDQYEGTGMGLSICKKIVESRGGTIAVESTPGVGSRFVVTLPAATPAAPAAAADAPANPAEPAPRALLPA
jgi:light-regulated signal transduction histidine kinase (bacteriophytochrome)